MVTDSARSYLLRLLFLIWAAQDGTAACMFRFALRQWLSARGPKRGTLARAFPRWFLRKNSNNMKFPFSSISAAALRVERVITSSNGRVARHLPIGLDSMLQCVQFPTLKTNIRRDFRPRRYSINNIFSTSIFSPLGSCEYRKIEFGNFYFWNSKMTRVNCGIFPLRLSPIFHWHRICPPRGSQKWKISNLGNLNSLARPPVAKLFRSENLSWYRKSLKSLPKRWKKCVKLNGAMTDFYVKKNVWKET